jgi:hypothetical protein
MQQLALRGWAAPAAGRPHLLQCQFPARLRAIHSLLQSLAAAHSASASEPRPPQQRSVDLSPRAAKQANMLDMGISQTFETPPGVMSMQAVCT